MAEQRTIAEICADAVELLSIIGGMTQGTPGGFIQGRAEAFRREMRRAAPDPALADALNAIGELEASVIRLGGELVEREEQIAHLRQSVEILEERSLAVTESMGAEPDCKAFELVTVEDLDARTAEEPAAQEVEEKPSPKAPAQPAEPAPAQIPSKHGSVGHSVNAVKARRFRLFGVSNGIDTGYIDEGSAGELANRNHIGPSTVYKLANTGKVGIRFRVEEVV